MKTFIKSVAIFFLVSASYFARGQAQSVSIGTSATDNNAVLWLVGNGSQGLILPTTTNAAVIPLTAGMIVYETPTKKIFYCDGSSWASIGGGSGSTALLSVSGNSLSIGSSGSGSVAISNAPPSAAGQLLMWDNTNSRWTATSATPAVANGNVLTWNGTAWAPAPSAGGGNMSTTTYDIAANGIVDNAEKIANHTWPVDGVGVLQNNGLGTLTWAPAVASLSNPMTTLGDMIMGAAGGTPARLASSTGILKSSGASPSWGTVDLSSAFNVSNLLGTTNGGTGASTALQNNIFAGPTVGTGAPSFRAMVAGDVPNLDAAKITTGTLPIARGGTGLSLATPANGSLLIGNGAGLTNALLTAGAGISIVNGAGSISISSTGLTNPLTTTGDIIYGVGTTPTRLAGSAGFLKSTGAAAPTWGAVNLATTDVTGILTAPNGGTGSSSYTWPAAAAGANTFLRNDGVGNLTWVTGATVDATGLANTSVPRSNGSSMVTSNIVSDGTNVGIGATQNANDRLILVTTATSNGINVNNARAGVAANTGIATTANSSTLSNTGLFSTANGGTTTTGVSGASTSGAGGTGYAIYGNALGTGTVNTALYGNASGGTINWAGYFANGNVAIEHGLAVGVANNFGASGEVLTSQGLGNAPTWQAIVPGIAPINTIIRGNATGTAQVASSLFDNGLTYTGLGRSTPIGSSRFDIATNAPSGNYGGMYMDTQAGGRPFYGFSQGAGGGAWIEWDGSDANKMKFINGSPWMTIQSNGFTGIGTTTPSTELEVSALSPQLTLRTTGAGVTESAILRFVNGAGTLIGSIGDSGSSTQLQLVSPTSISFNTNFTVRGGITNTGNYTINAPSSGTALDVTGFGNWDLSSTEGDLKIGSSTHRLKLGIALSGGGAGDAYIATQGGTNRLFLGTSETFANTQTLTITGSKLGVGIITPGAVVDISPTATLAQPIGLRVNNDYGGGAGNKIGVFSTLTATGTTTKYGFFNSVSGTAGNGSSIVGTYNDIVPGGTGAAFGTYNIMSNVGTGSRYGTYTSIQSAAGNASAQYGNYTFVNHAGTGTVYGTYIDANKAAGQAGTLYGLNVTSDNDGTGDSFLLYSNSIGSTTGKEWGLYVIGEDVDYMSGSLAAAGGNGNTIGLSSAAIGSANVASGIFSMAIGNTTTVSGDYSVALGSFLNLTGDGSMYVGDRSVAAQTTRSSANRFYGRFDNGYFLYTQANELTGMFVSNGGSSWSVVSDSTKKENFRPVNGEQLLTKLSGLKLGTWNYKANNKSMRHYGPMAQEFFDAFGKDGIGYISSDTAIASQDMEGVNMTAIQALVKRTDELRAEQKKSAAFQEELLRKMEEIESLRKELNKLETSETRVAELERSNQDMKAEMAEIREAVGLRAKGSQKTKMQLD